MAYRDSTTATGSDRTPAVAVPAGVQVGDIVILAFGVDAQDAAVDSGDIPTDFTELAETDITADGHTAWIGWKRLTAEDSGSYTFGSIGGANSTPEWVCQAYAFSGRHATDPPVVSTTAVQNTGQSSPVTITANEVTALDGDDLLWVSVPDVTASGVGNGHTKPAAFDAEAEDQEHAGGWANLSGAYLNNVAAGATGTVAGTFALTGNTAGWAAWLVRIPSAGEAPRRWLLGAH